MIAKKLLQLLAVFAALLGLGTAEAAHAAGLERLVDKRYGSAGFSPVRPGLENWTMVMSLDERSGAFIVSYADGAKGASKAIKLNASGRIDQRFGTVKLRVRDRIMSAYGHSSGGLLLSNIDTNVESGRVEVRRLTRVGGIDRRFGRRGVVKADEFQNFDARARLFPFPDGSFAVISRVSPSRGEEPLTGTAFSEIRFFDSRGRPVRSFGSAGIVRLPEFVSSVTFRAGVPGGLIVGTIDRLEPLNESEWASYSPIVRVRALDPNGSVSTSWGENGLIEWKSPPAAIVDTLMRHCDCGSRNFRFQGPVVTTTDRGLLMVTHTMSDPSDIEDEPTLGYWQSWLQAGGATASLPPDVVVGVRGGIGNADPGEGATTESVALRNGRSVVADSYADCYYSPCSHSQDLTVTTLKGVVPTRTCVSYSRRERISGFGFVGANRSGVFVAATKGSRPAIALIPYSRISRGCRP